ncbi:MAG: hypothetical protein KAJ19_03990 [Gammaproteobacteria bacterium]|nr:hypothetical protein [Gammaproteobacteria bacterium]
MAKYPMFRNLFLFLVLNSLPVSALGFYPEERMDFSFELDSSISNWVITGAVAETRVNRLGFSLYEYSSEYFQPGLHGGNLDVTQLDNATTAGMALSGNYLGASVRSRVPLLEHLSLRLQAAYIYHTAEQTLISQETQLKWSDTEVEAGFGFHFGHLEIFVGTAYYAVDGDEASTGTISQTRTFSEEDDTNSYAGVHLPIDATGSMQIQVGSGARKMTRLVFMRQF